MVSDCNITHGCGDEEGDSMEIGGVEKQYSFSLKSALRPSGKKPVSSRLLCLAADSKDDFTKWVNVIGIVSQVPDTVRYLTFFSRMRFLRHLFLQEDLWLDIARQRMQLSPAEFPSPDCRGFLLKLDGNSKTWKRRYCILADSCLFLYSDFDAQTAIGKKTGYKLEILHPKSSISRAFGFLGNKIGEGAQNHGFKVLQIKLHSSYTNPT